MFTDSSSRGESSRAVHRSFPGVLAGMSGASSDLIPSAPLNTRLLDVHCQDATVVLGEWGRGWSGWCRGVGAGMVRVVPGAPLNRI